MMTNSVIISGQIAYLVSSGIMPAFHQAAQETGMDRHLLLAIASRESNMGLALDGEWLGDHGNGIGIMQIDRRHHPEFAARVAAGNHVANIREGARILRQNLDQFGGNIRLAVAAYNAGIGAVTSAMAAGRDPDHVTTGRDYARDVLARYEIIRGFDRSSALQMSIFPLLIGLTVVAAASGLAYTITQRRSS